MSKSQKKARKRQILAIADEVDALEQFDEHGNECMASLWRRSELIGQLDKLGVKI